MDFEAILLKAQQKAQKIAHKVERALQKNNEIDPNELALRLSEKLSKKEPTNQLPEKGNIRLDLDFVRNLYEKSGLKPGHSKYWFAEDYPKNPLIQVSRFDSLRMQGTPTAAYCLFLRKEIVEGKSTIQNYIKNNSVFVNIPSNEWCLGQISQLTGLSCSYILGFDNGYDGNAKLHRNCTSDARQGYEDGLLIRKKFIEEGLLLEELDSFANESAPEKISELLRVGYYTEEESNDSSS